MLNNEYFRGIIVKKDRLGILKRENGNKDWRMLPIAIGVWSGCFLGKWFSDFICCSSKISSKENFHKDSIQSINSTVITCVFAFFVLCICVILYVLVLKRNAKTRCDKRKYSFNRTCVIYFRLFWLRNCILVFLIIFAIMLAFIMSFISSSRQYSDILTQIASNNKVSKSFSANANHRSSRHIKGDFKNSNRRSNRNHNININSDSVKSSIKNRYEDDIKNSSKNSIESENTHFLADLTVDTPLRVSNSFNGDCSANVSVSSLRFKTSDLKSVVYKSSSSAKLYAYKPICAFVVYGSSFRSDVTISISKFNSQIIEITIPKTASSVTLLKNPSVYHSMLNSLWKSFYKVTENLDDQGRILVPGLTVGLLGQEYFPSDSSNSEYENTIDSTYADCVKENFKHAGIMHLMAVSGGHFLLLSAFIRRLCSYFLIPKRFTAFLEVLSCVFLASIVYPSASVFRALSMCLISSIAFAIGRPYQSISALSWTVCLTLLVKPCFAWDYAFSLSCAATIGIIIMGVPFQKYLSMLLPKWLASALSITVCAWFFTMPIQILMQPEISFMSTFANLMVSPFVDWATICGLISLTFSIFNNSVGLLFARASSIGTGIMERCAYLCNEYALGVFPWMKGALGAWLILGVELVLFVSLIIISKLVRKLNIVSQSYIALQLTNNKAKRIVDDSLKLFTS